VVDGEECQESEIGLRILRMLCGRLLFLWDIMRFVTLEIHFYSNYA
jgi:hypothetical protein